MALSSGGVPSPGWFAPEADRTCWPRARAGRCRSDHDEQAGRNAWEDSSGSGKGLGIGIQPGLDVLIAAQPSLEYLEALRTQEAGSLHKAHGHQLGQDGAEGTQTHIRQLIAGQF